MTAPTQPAVDVWERGRWVPAQLVDTISDLDGVFRGLVEYTTHDGQAHREWRPVQEMRPVEATALRPSQASPAPEYATGGDSTTGFLDATGGD